MSEQNPNKEKSPGYVAGMSEEELRLKYNVAEIVKIGSNENPLGPSPRAVEAMQQAVPRLHRYPPMTDERLRGAIAASLGNGVTPDHVVTGNGACDVLSMIADGFLGADDECVICRPTFPVYEFLAKRNGATVVHADLDDRDFAFNVESILHQLGERTRIVFLCSPNNPTGTVATPEFYRELVDFAHKHGIVIVQDAAYGALTYDGHKPMSILSTDGAMEVAVEVHSLSKAFNMTGWRIAFLVGSETSAKLYGTVKDNTDSGQFRAIQKAACAALEDPSITQRTIAKYSRRFDLLVDALREIGFEANKPKGTFYIYVPIPKATRSGRTFGSAEEVSEYLIKEASVSTVPWDDAGSFLRFSVTFEADLHEEEQIIHEMKERIKALDLVF